MKKKRIIILAFIIVISIFIICGYNSFFRTQKFVLDENSDLISIFVEGANGEYQNANSFPGAGYVLDRARSKCENGGFLSGDGTGVTLTANKTDKCYLYFSIPMVNSVISKTISCSDGNNNFSPSWDNKLNGFNRSIFDDFSCTVSKASSVPSLSSFGNYIISLVGTTQGDGQVVNENGYRYEGKDPNNYIWFNGELWRIIGVFDYTRHGVSGQNLVKIIRNQSIGAYAWNGVENCSNDLTSSTLFRMLNGCYFNALTGSDTTNISGQRVACSNYCVKYYGSSTRKATSDCDFSVIGFKNKGLGYDYKDLVQEVTWYLGGPGASGYDTYDVDSIASYEINSSAVYSGRASSVIANIGLVYLSDFGYSTPASTCARATSMMNTATYSSTACAGNSWLYNQGYEFSITPSSLEDNKVWPITGLRTTTSACNAYQVRPVLYLKEDTFKISGNGTSTNPYVVGM